MKCKEKEGCDCDFDEIFHMQFFISALVIALSDSLQVNRTPGLAARRVIHYLEGLRWLLLQYLKC